MKMIDRNQLNFYIDTQWNNFNFSKEICSHSIFLKFYGHFDLVLLLSLLVKPGRRNVYFHVKLKKNSSESMVKGSRVTRSQYSDTPKSGECWNEPRSWHPKSFTSLLSCVSLDPALPELSIKKKKKSSKLWYLPGIYGFLNVGEPFKVFKKTFGGKTIKGCQFETDVAHSFHFIKTLIRGRTLFSEARGVWRLLLRTCMGQPWVWPVKGPFGSTASCSTSVVLEQDISHSLLLLHGIWDTSCLEGMPCYVSEATGRQRQEAFFIGGYFEDSMLVSRESHNWIWVHL